MVGGLVHDQQVGRRGTEPRQCGLGLLAAGELADRLKDEVAGQAEAGQQVADVPLHPFGVVLGPDGPHHGRARRERLQVLVVVANLDPVAKLDLAAIGFLLADQGLDQRGLARAVRTHHAHALAAEDRDVQVLEQGLVVGLGQIPGLDDDVARAVDLLKAHDGPDDLAHRFDPLAFQPLKLPFAVVGLLGALPRAILADVGLELLGLLLLPPGLPLQHLGLFGAEPPVLRVVTRVDLELALVQLPRLVTTLSRK